LKAVSLPRRWTRWLTERQTSGMLDLSSLRETCQRLADAGGEVMIVERLTGNVHQPAELFFSNNKN
jgi:hypothetical protein